MEQITWNQHVVKKKNKDIVLRTITAMAPLSRAEIAQRSGLNKATVSSLVSELIDEELIYESGPGESSGGRRPVMLLFNEQAGYSIGIDIGVNYILGVVTDLVGNIIYEKNKSIKSLSFEDLIVLVKETIQTLINNTPKSKYGVIGIGIGVPGIVDTNGKVLLAPNLKWKNVNLLEIIKKDFDYPIIIENEANAGAYGETRFGAGQESSNSIYISVGIGIGVGIILNGQLYRGFNGYSGESGHMTIMVNGEECTCGSTGCWEAYASEHALLKEARLSKQFSVSTLEELIQLAQTKDLNTIKLFHKIGSFIGIGATNLIKTFNPQQVIIGNRLAKAEPWIRDAIIGTVKKETSPFHQADMQLDFSKLSIYSTALGVSAFVIEEFLIEQAKKLS
ncbi:ROK family transcriptional regulator [Cytobacillus sp. S13-E01]|uniref:ROK family transcriptional regulator n=1 Tax=Cytobacillus sp. S13-E01 TaxID=3031326 RepID=UPI0023D857D6|nr:ROK family transcriptional regulator [Cytobacillus sp. S13-E01]MDF0725818.1 ROK family transcriptional regulator [Cytobacillus sp. S13-E01]